MGKSIKRSVGIRVACAIVAIFLFSGMTTMNILRIEGTQNDSVRATNMLGVSGLCRRFGKNEANPPGR